MQAQSGSRGLGEGYVRRYVDRDLDDLLPSLPAVLLDGPKGVGKTATALQRAATVHHLSRASERAVAEADSSMVVTGSEPILIDEWQRVPSTWDEVKLAVDANPAGGRLIRGPAGSQPYACAP